MHCLILALALSATPEPRPDAAAQADAVVAKAFAAPAAREEAAPAPVGRMAGAGLGLATLIGVVLLAMRRRGQTPSGGYAQVTQNLSVGRGRSLLVVAFGQKRLLVGSSEGSFTVLSTEPLAATAESSAFDAALAQQLQSWSATVPATEGTPQ